MTDLEFVVDLQVLFGSAFSHNVLQHCGRRGVRDIIVQRKGEGEVGLSVGFDIDVLACSASDGVVADRINKLYTTFVRSGSQWTEGHTHIQLNLIESDAEEVGVFHSVGP